MKLTCDACKLTLNARDEDRGKSFTCPICRGPLREADGAPKPAEEPKRSPAPALEWSGGSLDDLVYMVNSQALAAVLEVYAPEKKGEVHVIAGGVDEAFHDGARGDDAMDALRGYEGARFRVELRLPSDAGSMLSPNADRGDLKSRPLAKLMRYCEEYVLTCDLEAWRGSETCRVEYRRGNIARTLINGIDAPEQLAEVMGWTSGNYRFVLPRLALPTGLDEASRAQARAAAETRISEQKAARKTIFGMPAAQLMGVMAAAGQAGAGGSGAQPTQPSQSQAPGAAAAGNPSASQPPSQKTLFMGSAPSIAPPPGPSSPPAREQPMMKTIMGMPAAPMPQSQPAGREQPQSQPPSLAGAPPGKTMPVGPSPPPGPASVVIDSAYAAASAPVRGDAPQARVATPTAATGEADEDALRTTARGYQPVAGTQPPGAAAAPGRAEESERTPEPKKKRASATPDPERREKAPTPVTGTRAKERVATASARRSGQPERAQSSPWVNVGIAITVAVGIVVIWLLVSMIAK